jgi:hypothetical protein
LRHLGGLWQVKPNLEQLQRVGLVGVDEREHLSMHHSSSCSHPLHVALSIPTSAAQRIGVIDEALNCGSDGLESAVWVLQ